MRTKLLPLLLAAALLAGCAGPGGQSGSESQSGAPASQPQVQADWSVLEEGAQALPAIYHRWYPDYADALFPRTDYGQLIPFAGAAALVTSPVAEEYSYTTCLYGLMTGEGKVVMEPVCSAISRASYANEDGESVFLPVLMLEKGDGERGNPADGTLLALAAADGSWCTDFVYWGCTASPTALLAGDGEKLYLLAPETGEAVKEWSWAKLGIDDARGVPWYTGDAYSCVQWTGDRFFLGCYGENWEEARFLDPMTGEVTTTTAQAWYKSQDERYQSLSQSWWSAQSNGDGTYTLSMGEDYHRILAPLDMGETLPHVRGDRVIFDNYQGSFAVTSLEGQVLLPAQEGTLTVIQSDWEEAGLWLAVKRPGEEQWIVYNWEGELSSIIPGAQDSWCVAAGALLGVQSNTCAAYYRPEDGECLLRVYFDLPG